VYDCNAVAHRIADGSKMLLLSVHQNLTSVLRLNTGQNFHQRTFPGSVFTNDRKNFPGHDAKADTFERFDARKRLGDVANFKSRDRKYGG
jgi:hypothetical protein